MSHVAGYVADRLARGEIVDSSATVITAILHGWERFAGPPPWTEEQAAAWVNDPAVRPNTRKSRLTKLRPYVRWLLIEGHIERDPTLRLGRIRVPDGDPRDLSHTEVAELLRACPDDRATLIVQLMVQCSLRCSDIARIRIEDIDRNRRILHVRAKGGGGEHTHWIPVPDQAWHTLTAWLRRSGARTGPLIVAYDRSRRLRHVGLTGHSIGRMVRAWIDLAGLKEFPYDGRSAHALRHTCAQHMLDAGADLRDVQHALGHRTIRSTEIYLRREPPGLRAAMEGRRYAS